MKKALTIFFTVASVFMMLDSIDAGQAIVVFFLAGQVPGTSIVISASTMFEMYLLVLGFIGARLTIAATSVIRAAILSHRATNRRRLA